MKKVKLLFLATLFVFITSCEKESSHSTDNNTFVYDKTSILFDTKKTVVNTENSYSDFSYNMLLINENVEISDDFIKSKINENLWFVPFDKNEKPILLNEHQNTVKSFGDIHISCYCGMEAAISTCDPEGTSNGGTTTYVCVGGCINPITGEDAGECKMKVVIKERSGILSDVSIFNGIIISAKKVAFNGIVYQ